MTWFVDAQLHAQPFPDAFYFGAEWSDGRLRLGKLAGLMYSGDGVRRLQEHNPEVEAIVILRDPVARAYSSFWFARRRGREPRRTFEDAITGGTGRLEDLPASTCTYLEWGCYEPYVRRLYDALGRESVHVVILEEFVHGPKRALGPLLERLRLDPAPLGDEAPSENGASAVRLERLARLRMRSRKRGIATRVLPREVRDVLRRQYWRMNETTFRPPPMDPGTERKLRALFDQPNKRLEELLSRRIEAWRTPAR